MYSVNGILTFDTKTAEIEGDYTFGNVEVWIEASLSATSDTKTIYVEDNDELKKLNYCAYNDESSSPYRPNIITQRTLEIFDYKNKKKKTYEMVLVKEEDIER